MMMTSEENYYRAIQFENPAWIPVAVSIMEATWAKHREAMEEIVLEYPRIFGRYEKGSRNFDRFEGTYRAGDHRDAWGCLWRNVAPGLDGLVVGHPLPRREDVHAFRPPSEHTGLPHGFMFMRLYYLRGYEELMIDFAEEPPELSLLIDKVLAYNLQEVEFALHSKPRMLIFGDDLGNQDFLPIHPEKWKKYLQPCYQQIFGKCHASGTLVYLHSDGHILEIIGALIESGVDVLNPQVGANGLDHLASIAKGKVAINLDLDRQKFPFWTPEEIDAHVQEAVDKLNLPAGGLLLFAEIEPDVPLQNVRAICSALQKYSGIDKIE